MVVHDGMGVVGQEREVREGSMPEDLVGAIINRAKEYSQARGHRVTSVVLLARRLYLTYIHV